MATKKSKDDLHLYILSVNFTALQTRIRSKKHLTTFLKKITGGLCSKDVIELQVSDCFRGGHRDGVRFKTTNKKVYDRALKFLTKLQNKKGCLSVRVDTLPGPFHRHHDEGEKYASLSINY